MIYSRPPFYAALLRPLAALPYREAYWLFQSLNAALFATLFWFWLRPDPLLAIFGGISIPVVMSFANGQDILLLVVICAIAFELERRGKKFACGLLLPLLAIKFHLFLFVPLVLLVQKRWRSILGAAVGASILFLIAAFEQGLDWPVAYFHFLRTAEITPTPTTMPNLHGLILAIIGDSAPVEIILAACVALAVIFIAASIADFGPSLALAIVAGLLTSHHAYIQDMCLLLLIPVLAPDLPITRRITLAFLAPPAYFLLMLDGPPSAIVPFGILTLLAAIGWEAARIHLPVLKTA